MLLHKKEFFGNGFFTADHVTVCGLLVLFLCYFGLYIRTHVETVVLLSQQNPDEHIRIKIDLTDRAAAIEPVRAAGYDINAETAKITAKYLAWAQRKA